MFTTIATCSPFLDGFGFRAELQSDGRRYKLVSWDCTIPGETRYHLPSGPYGEPVVRAECRCDDLRPGASVGIGVPIFPGVSVGIGVGTGGVGVGKVLYDPKKPQPAKPDEKK